MSKHEYWLSIIEKMRSSGKTQKQWCAENGISYNSIRFWLKKFSKEKIKWVQVVDVKVKNNICISIGKFSVEIPADFEPNTLLNICRVLNDVSC